MRPPPVLALLLVLGALPSCGSTAATAAPTDAGLADLGAVVPAWDGGDPAEAPHPQPVDGGYVVADAGALIRADRFATSVVSFVPGDCGGFGAARMDVVLGPPVGAGDNEGSLDVVSLGNGGTIVLSFGSNAIVDGPGADFVVFENPFYIGGSRSSLYAEPGEVSVSEDGATWKTFPCTATAASGPPYGACAGWRPVYSSPTSGITPIDPQASGGDPFDLGDVGLARARYVRIRDMGGESCPLTPPKSNQNGFDLDGIAVVNAETP